MSSVVNPESRVLISCELTKKANPPVARFDKDRYVYAVHTRPAGVHYEIVGTTTDERSAAVICRIKETGKLLFITTYALE